MLPPFQGLKTHPSVVAISPFHMEFKAVAHTPGTCSARSPMFMHSSRHEHRHKGFTQVVTSLALIRVAFNQQQKLDGALQNACMH